jgi:uncharacterized damage-inducible protein DinB
VITGISAFASVARLNTRLFLNCLDGVSQEHADARPNQQTNSIAFVACHLVDARHFLARYLGLSEPNPMEEALRDVQRIEEVKQLPQLDEIRRAWKAIAQVLDGCFATLTEDDLRTPSGQRLPVDDPTVFGGIGFLIQHESYHIGQLALLRKYFGYPAMKYG